MLKLFSYNTTIGPIFIARTDDGEFQIQFDDRPFGTYESAKLAASALAHGHTILITPEHTAASLRIPEALDKWSPCDQEVQP